MAMVPTMDATFPAVARSAAVARSCFTVRSSELLRSDSAVRKASKRRFPCWSVVELGLGPDDPIAETRPYTKACQLPAAASMAVNLASVEASDEAESRNGRAAATCATPSWYGSRYWVW